MKQLEGYVYTDRFGRNLFVTDEYRDGGLRLAVSGVVEYPKGVYTRYVCDIRTFKEVWGGVFC